MACFTKRDENVNIMFDGYTPLVSFDSSYLTYMHVVHVLFILQDLFEPLPH
jgi:hypothetical protein